MKYMLIIASLLVVSGCESEPEVVDDKLIGGLSVVCLEGVEYYYYKVGNRMAITPVVDSETLTFVKCAK